MQCTDVDLENDEVPYHNQDHTHAPGSDSEVPVPRVFDILLEGETSGVVCIPPSPSLSQESGLGVKAGVGVGGLSFPEERLVIDYRDVVYFQIPSDDPRDVFEYDSQPNPLPHNSPRPYYSQFGVQDDEEEEMYEGLFLGVLWFIRDQVTPTAWHLEFQSSGELAQFHSIVSHALAQQTWRPKKVLIFLNPASGRGRAIDTYEETLADILRLADIVPTVRITDKEGANSVKGVLHSIDYARYDAIVIVGGDGSYRDAVSAIYEKAHNQGSIRLDQDCLLPPIGVKFAIIPTGSGNGVVHYLTRSFTVEQAAFALVLGKTTPLPVVTVRNTDDHSLVGLAIVCVNYGVTSDAIVVANNWKFLGPGKYIVGVTSAMLKHKSFRAQIELECLREKEEPDAVSVKSIPGEFKDIMMLVNGISDSDETYPRSPRLCGDLFITPECTLMQQTGFLVNLGLYSQKIYRDPTVACYKSTALSLHLSDKNEERAETSGFINIDGDIYPLNQPGCFDVRYFPSLVNACALGFSHPS